MSKLMQKNNWGESVELNIKIVYASGLSKYYICNASGTNQETELKVPGSVG